MRHDIIEHEFWNTLSYDKIYFQILGVAWVVSSDGGVEMGNPSSARRAAARISASAPPVQREQARSGVLTR